MNVVKSMRCFALASCILAFGWGGVDAGSAADQGTPDHVFSDGVEVYFLSADEAASAIVDDSTGPFFEKLTLLDIELRLGHKLESKDLKKEQDKFTEFVRGCVLDWAPDEKKALLSTAKSAHAKCAKVVPSLIPHQWRFIKTDGKEGGAPYTRGMCIVFPQSVLGEESKQEHVLIHETFHVYSRANPKMRTQLYGAIGFEHLEGVSLPPSLEAKRLTNPDGVDYGYAIDLTDAKGRKIKAIPVVHSKYDGPKKGVDGFFSYVTFGLFEVQTSEGSWSVATNKRGKAKALSLSRVKGFFEQIGHNTGYIIHPDEILADNVALLVLSRAGDKSARINSPDVLKKIAKVLGAK